MAQNSSYFPLVSACLCRKRFYYPDGVHAETVAVRPSCDLGVLTWQEDKTKVDVLSYSKCNLHWRHACCQELVGILDGHIFMFYQVLGD